MLRPLGSKAEMVEQMGAMPWLQAELEESRVEHYHWSRARQRCRLAAVPLSKPGSDPTTP